MYQIEAVVEALPPRSDYSKYLELYHQVAAKVAGMEYRNGSSPAVPISCGDAKECYAIALGLKSLSKQYNGNLRVNVRARENRVYVSRAS